jgi:hypothetical protein
VTNHTEPTRPTGARRWIVSAVATLSALGVLGAVGAYYVPGILDRLGAGVTDRLPFDVEFLGDRTLSPSYLFPGAVQPGDVPSELLQQRNLPELRRWAADHGGVIADRQRMRFVLRGRTDAVAHIDDVRVRVVERRPPRCGWVNMWGPLGGVVEPRLVRFDLDTDAPARWYVDDQPAERPAFTVTATEEETIDVDLSTSDVEADWVIEVTYSSAERDGVLVIDDHGRPFVMTTAARAVAYTKSADGHLVRDPDSDGSAAAGCTGWAGPPRCVAGGGNTRGPGQPGFRRSCGPDRQRTG